MKLWYEIKLSDRKDFYVTEEEIMRRIFKCFTKVAISAFAVFAGFVFSGMTSLAGGYLFNTEFPDTESYDTGIVKKGMDSFGQAGIVVENHTGTDYPGKFILYLNDEEIASEDENFETGHTYRVQHTEEDIYGIADGLFQLGLIEDASLILPWYRVTWDATKLELCSYYYCSDPANEDPVVPRTYHETHMSSAELLPKSDNEGKIELRYDGMPVLVCSVCGQVHENYSEAQVLWEKEVVSAIEDIMNFDEKWNTSKAEANEPVTIKSTTFISFDKNTLSKLGTSVQDITLKFKYNGSFYSTTIPAGTDFVSLADENGWAGFAYIMSLFGGRELTAEEFAM